MDLQHIDSSMAISVSSNSYPTMNGPSLNHLAWFEVRLFYVRISPCVVDSVPDHLILRHLRREIGVLLEINGSRFPPSDAASIVLRRDRLNKEESEVTYVSTDSVRITGGVDFEVYDNEALITCGYLEKMETNWVNGSFGSENDAAMGWRVECYMAASTGSGSSALSLPNLGASAPLIEVYIAGCCSGTPVILTKTIQISPRRKNPRHGFLDAIPEDEEIRKETTGNGLCLGPPIIDEEFDDYNSDDKARHGVYPEYASTGEDGQLTLFNAGVRVGVGIGLGMCVGIGIGVGLLISSYQATARNFRRRFF